MNLPMRIIRSAPSLYTNPVIHRVFDGPNLGRDSIELSDAILSASGKRIIVDSSKSALKFWSVYKQQPNKVRTVILVRDYRAVVFSKMKRGQSLKNAARGWRQKLDQIEALTRGVPADRCYRLKYESLCIDPAKELASLCAFLDIAFDANMLSRPEMGVHHIGGSPSKFDPSKRAISLDRTYEDAFDRDEMELMQKIVGNVASVWGY